MSGNVARCPLCGAWTWRGKCLTPHERKEPTRDER